MPTEGVAPVMRTHAYPAMPVVHPDGREDASKLCEAEFNCLSWCGTLTKDGSARLRRRRLLVMPVCPGDCKGSKDGEGEGFGVDDGCRVPVTSESRLSTKPMGQLGPCPARGLPRFGAAGRADVPLPADVISEPSADAEATVNVVPLECVLVLSASDKLRPVTTRGQGLSAEATPYHDTTEAKG